MRRYADRRDNNEETIKKYLERCGCMVKPISQRAIPDLLVSSGPLGSFVILLEVKSSKGKLTPSQERLFQTWGNSFFYIVRSIADVKTVLREFMPVRIYECPEHGLFEKRQEFSEEPLTHCPKCAKIVKQKYTVPYVIYKGNGWASKNDNSSS